MAHEELEINLTTSEAYNSAGRFAEAEVLAKNILFETEGTLQSQVQYLHALLILAESYLQRGLLHEAQEVLEHTLLQSEKISDKDLYARALNGTGSVYFLLSEYTRSLEFFQKALSVNEEIGNNSGMATNIGNIGNVYWNLSNYPLALEHYQRALVLDTAEGNQAGVARHLGNIGNVYRNLSDYTKCLEYFQQALTIDEALGNQAGVARHLGNIGSLYSLLNDSHHALEFYQMALALSEKLGNKAHTAINLGNISSVYFQLSDYPLALEYSRKALAIDEIIGNKSGMSRHLGNIGSIYLELKDYSRSLEYLHKALSMNEDIGNKAGIAANTGNIADVYLSSDIVGSDLKKGEEYLLKALQISAELGMKQEQYIYHSKIADLYEKQQRWEEFAYHYKQYHTLEKEVQNDEVQKQTTAFTFERQIAVMQREQEVTERILHNILPKEIAVRIRRGDQRIVDSYESVSVLFADIVGFTKISQLVTPEQLVAGLDTIFNTFDRLAEKHGCEKIKTIGDSYMVVAGLPERCDDHAKRLASMALDMITAMKALPAMVESVEISMRIGLHSGSVVAGIIGKNKFAYDLWGDAVNTASRMESHGESDKIHVTEAFKNAAGKDFYFTERGIIEIKGKGKMKTYYLEKNA